MESVTYENRETSNRHSGILMAGIQGFFIMVLDPALRQDDALGAMHLRCISIDFFIRIAKCEDQFLCRLAFFC